MERSGWAKRGYLRQFSPQQATGLATTWEAKFFSWCGNFSRLGGVPRGCRLGRQTATLVGAQLRDSRFGTGTIQLSGSTGQVFEGGQSGSETNSSGLTSSSNGIETPLMRRKRVEAVLFLSRLPVAGRKLSQLAGLADATEVRTLVRQLNQVYAETGRAYRAEEVAGGYQLLTRPPLAPWLRRLGHIPKTLQLTPPALETLAIVAYRQPVLKAEIEAIRGVSCGEILRQLMDRDLVRISGRSEELGRPYLYSTTKCFLQTFGFRDADALPALDRTEFTISENPDWSHASASSDPSLDQQQPVNDVPEEESDVSTALANLEIDNPERDEATSFGLFPGEGFSPASAVDEDDDDIFEDDEEEEDDFEDDDDWDGDEDEEDLEDEDEEELEVEADGDWEEVDDEEDDADEDEEADDDEEEDEEWEDEEDEDWEDDDDVDDDDDEDEEEWD